MSTTYSDVDGSNDPARAVDCQELVDAWPQVRAYKTYSYSLLPSGDVLDIGCGPGIDVAALDVGRAFGVDLSVTMCRAAARRGAVAACADASHLPFPDTTFAGVRADRVVQHVADPEAAVSEMVRVCRADRRERVVRLADVGSDVERIRTVGRR